MSQRLSGKVALITGAADGIGRAHAEIFAREGAKVVISDIRGELGEEVAVGIRAKGGEAIALSHDVTSEDDWRKAIAATIEAFGTLTTLINNAGISNLKGVEEEDLAGFNQVVAVCQTGVWLGMKAAMPALKKTGNAAIINVSSLYGIVGSPSMIAYHAAKAAVKLMTKSAALEYAGQGIRVNSVHPGVINTTLVKSLSNDYGNMIRAATPAGRFGEPSDIAYGSLYLCSDEALFVTGSQLVISGGLGLTAH